MRPPVAQWSTWWTSHHAGGRSQPGNRQWRSLRITARRIAGGTTGVRRPTSRGSERAPSTTRITEASQASCRTAPAGPDRRGRARPCRKRSRLRDRLRGPSPRRPLRHRAEPGRAGQHLDRHRHREVGPLPGHHGSVTPVQEPPADLPQGVGPALGGGALVGASPAPRARTSASSTAPRAVSRLSPVRGSRSPSTRTIPPSVTEACRRRRAERGSDPAGLLGLHPVPPARHHPAQLAHRVDPGGLHQQAARPPRTPRDRPRGLPTRTRAAAIDSSPSSTAARVAGHRRERPRHPDLVAGRAPAHPAAAVHEPGGDRQVPVVGEGAPAVDLAQPAQALELEQLDAHAAARPGPARSGRPAARPASRCAAAPSPSPARSRRPRHPQRPALSDPTVEHMPAP